MRIAEVISNKPPTPEQQRIKTMQAQQRVKQERIRQQQMKLNQQRSKLTSV